ncbi:uncharacterized protein LOC144110683 [Amblyomma americanum]
MRSFGQQSSTFLRTGTRTATRRFNEASWSWQEATLDSSADRASILSSMSGSKPAIRLVNLLAFPPPPRPLRGRAERDTKACLPAASSPRWRRVEPRATRPFAPTIPDEEDVAVRHLLGPSKGAGMQR